MQLPPEIIFKGVESTPEIDKLIDRGIAGLEQVCDYIVSTRIAVERAQKRHLTGNPYRMRIDIRIPQRPDIVVKRWSKAARKLPDGLAEVETEVATLEETGPVVLPTPRRSPSRRRGLREEPLAALVRRTFESARRELEEVVDRQHGEVKTPAHRETSGIVDRIFRDQGYGFLRNDMGEQVYFHRNSVLHDKFDDLTVGTIVRYVPETGEKGLQASTVQPVEKRGVAETHEALHELPVVAPSRRKKKA